MFYPPGGPGSENRPAGAQLFHQGGRSYLHIAENTGKALRRGSGINGDGDPVVMTGGEAAVRRQGRGAGYRQISRRQIEIAAVLPVFHPPFQTVMDLQPFPGTIPQFPADTGMNIPVVQLHTGEYPVPGHSGFTVGGVRIEAQRIGLAVVGGCAGGRESRSGKTHRILLYIG